MKKFKGILFVITLLCTTSAWSNQIEVVNLLNTGSGSLRNAIGAAVPGDTVLINVSGNIQLDNSILIDNKSDLTIIGPYPMHCTITASNSWGADESLFSISNSENVRILNIGFKPVNGGNFRAMKWTSNTGSNAIHNCLFDNLSVSGGSGGALNIVSTDLTVLNCSFIGNQSSEGGAIYLESSNLLSRNCTYAENNSIGKGGALQLNQGFFCQMHYNTFKDNNSGVDGECIGIIAGSTGSVEMMNNGADGNSTGLQFNEPNPGFYNSLGGNRIKQNSGLDIMPWIANVGDLATPGLEGKLHNPIVVDGYGLKYFTIIDSSSAFIDAPNSNAGVITGLDCRGAPRALTGIVGCCTPQPNPNPLSDAGACEFTMLRVENNSGNPAVLKSLPWCMLKNIDNLNYIEFDAGNITVLPDVQLIESLQPTIIDGFSQTGSQIPGPEGPSNNGVIKATLMVEIENGSNLINGISFFGASSGSRISGLRIVGFDGAGLFIQDVSDIKIQGNEIGITNFDNAYPNDLAGVLSNGGLSLIIGGKSHWTRNVISANGSGANTANIILENPTTDNLVHGNFIGTLGNGLGEPNSAPPNTIGIINKGINNEIGGRGLLMGNLISGNTGFGIFESASNGTVIQHNIIGLDYEGEIALANADGVLLDNGANTIKIGGLSDEKTRNIIAGHPAHNILMHNCNTIEIYGNYIGVDITGNNAPGGTTNGITLNSPSIFDIAIGDITETNSRNVISGNGNGIHLVQTAGNVGIFRNYIGTTEDGLSALANNQHGVWVESNVFPVNIGFFPGGNVISANGLAGIYFQGGTSGHLVQANTIGLNAPGNSALGNDTGIEIDGYNNVTIGGNFLSNEGNIISGNSGNGIEIHNGSDNTVISGNNIGLNAAGNADLSNGTNGIKVDNSGATSIGGSANFGNVVSGHNGTGDAGVFCEGNGTTAISSNRIGTNIVGSQPFGNETGIRVNGTHTVAIGSSSTNENYICASSVAGIHILSPSVSVNGNVIGLGTSDETAGMGNEDGILIQNTTQVGNLGTGFTNIISNNVNGIHIDGETSDNSTIDNCKIGITTASTPAGNSQFGIWIDQGDGNLLGVSGPCEVMASDSAAIFISNLAENNLIENFTIGDIGNTSGMENNIGVYLLNSPTNNSIGSTSLTSGNTIVNNTNQAILLNNADANLIRGNYIGVNASNTAGGNGRGIHLINSDFNVIGGDNTPGTGGNNIVSWNINEGILLENSHSNDLVGNFVGMDLSGTAQAPNLDGIGITNGSQYNLIGDQSGNNLNKNIISGNTNRGIYFDASDSNFVQWNHIGVDFAGTVPLNFQDYGIWVGNNSKENLVGGDVSIEKNIISGNSLVGVVIDESASNYVEGNNIGHFANQPIGIAISGTNSFNNQIGGTQLSNFGNTIIDNTVSGVEISTGAHDNFVFSNFIGLDGSTNTFSVFIEQPIGVHILSDAGTNNTIGNNSAGGGNVISGNTYGVQIEGNNQLVLNNLIGTDSTGMNLIGNSQAGVYITSSGTNNEIGGAGTFDENIVSGNQIGIHIDGTGTGNAIEGNNIGMNVLKSDTVPNVIGVYLEGGTNNNSVGTAGSGHENHISGNNVGVAIDASNSNVVQNNLVGVEFPNTVGIALQNGASLNQIGGDNNEKNVISGNDTIGLGIYQANGNFVYGNYIGMAANGNDTLPNYFGIFMEGASNNKIGGETNGFGNLISGNELAGVLLKSNSNSNEFVNNFIGTDLSGNDTLMGTGNTFGIILDSSHNNTIGGDWINNEGNVICGNHEDGIIMFGSSGNTVEGNNIGLSKDNSTFLGNLKKGVKIDNGSNGNFIGMPGNGHENIITANTDGIYVRMSSQNDIQNNFIGNDDTGGESTLPSGSNNQEIGVFLDTGSVDNDIFGLNIISGNLHAGVALRGNGTINNHVFGNRIGVAYSGNVSYANDSTNIYITEGAKFNVIGGTTPAEKNILGGDCVADVYIKGPGADTNQIAGNNIGLGIDDNTTYNSEYGIVVQEGTGNVIGGATANEGNYITDFNQNGIYILNSVATSILGNKIGIKPDNSPGTIDSAGVLLFNGDQTWIGSINPSSDSMNVITNCYRGVEVNGIYFVSNTYSSVIGGNSIYNNVNQGIDINGDDMVLPIDTANNDAWRNNGEIDRCEIVSAWNCGGSNTTHVGFKFYASNMLPNYNVQFYHNPNPDISGFGEGEVYIGNYQFDPGSPHDTISIDLGVSLPPNITTLTATITGVLGNTSEFSEQFEITDPPTFSPPNVTDEFCFGSDDGEIYIDAPEAYYFSIDGFTSFTNGIGGDTLYDMSPGVYNVEAKYLNGCILSQSATIGQGPFLPFDNIMTPDTCGLAVGALAFDTIPANLFGGTGDYIYSFDGGTTTSPIEINGQLSGSFDMFMQDTTLGCSSDVINVTITEINDVVDESFVYMDFCPGATALPTSVATSGGYFDFNPSVFDGAMIDSLSGEITNAVVGNSYTVEYTVGVCDESSTITVLASAVDDASFTYPDHCIGSTPTINPATLGGNWDLISGPGSINPSSGIITGIPGTYQVEYTTTNTCPNSDTNTVVIFAQPTTPTITALQKVYCPDETLQAMTTSGTSGLIYNWYDDPTLMTSISSGTSFTPPSLILGDNFFYLNATDGNGCVSSADSINYYSVDVSGMFAMPDFATCYQSDVQLEAYGGDQYLWSASNQITSNTTDSIVEATISIVENFVVTITDTNSCQVTDTVIVTLIHQDSCHIEVYNAFSPNNDGINDFWIIDGIEGYESNVVFIYNRWGDQVQRIEGYNNDDVVWDGTNKNGKTLPGGTYFYVVEASGSRVEANWVQLVK